MSEIVKFGGDAPSLERVGLTMFVLMTPLTALGDEAGDAIRVGAIVDTGAHMSDINGATGVGSRGQLEPGERSTRRRTGFGKRMRCGAVSRSTATQLASPVSR